MRPKEIAEPHPAWNLHSNDPIPQIGDDVLFLNNNNYNSLHLGLISPIPGVLDFTQPPPLEITNPYYDPDNPSIPQYIPIHGTIIHNFGSSDEQVELNQAMTIDDIKGVTVALPSNISTWRTPDEFSSDGTTLGDPNSVGTRTFEYTGEVRVDNENNRLMLEVKPERYNVGEAAGSTIWVAMPMSGDEK